jgi:general secretion pathway protein I
MRHLDNRTQGFTLLEVLVAFTIMALVLGVVLQVFSGGMRTAEIARNHAIGTLLAESKLAGIGIEEPLVEGQWTGTFDNGFRWYYTVERNQEQENGDAKKEEQIVPYRLALTVEWGSGRTGGSVTLTTLRLGTNPKDATGESRQ